MYKTWTAHGDDAEGVARQLEAHLNEYAQHVVSVAYAVAGQHYVLAVYKEVEAAVDMREEAAVTLAEHIIDEASA